MIKVWCVLFSYTFVLDRRTVTVKVSPVRISGQLFSRKLFLLKYGRNVHEYRICGFEPIFLMTEERPCDLFINWNSSREFTTMKIIFEVANMRIERVKKTQKGQNVQRTIIRIIAELAKGDTHLHLNWNITTKCKAVPHTTNAKTECLYYYMQGRYIKLESFPGDRKRNIASKNNDGRHYKVKSADRKTNTG